MRREKLTLIGALAQSARRAEVAAQLARHYRARRLLLFQKDSEVGHFLPAPAFGARLRHGKHWQAFLQRCVDEGCARDQLELQDSPGTVPALGKCPRHGLIVVLLGDGAWIDDDDPLFDLLPLLDHALIGERQAQASAAHLLLAREKAEDAALLAESLERVRRELAAALRKSRRAQEALQLSDKRKDDFLAVLAHELRNPLAPIGNGLELLKQLCTDPTLIKLLPIMDRQFHHVVRLIDDLMDISRISRGKISLKIEPVEFATILEIAIRESNALFEQKQHALELDLPCAPLTLHGDTSRLVQVFSNLLNNAAKYTPPGGRIRVKAYKDGETLQVLVSDNGVGLEPLQFERIFDLFAQVGSEGHPGAGGLGIGLSLVARLLHLHGGRISAHSEGLGQGSEFHVELPLMAADAGCSPRKPAAPATEQSGSNILVVDDNEDSARTLGQALEIMGHQVYLAFNGADALRQAQQQRPDLVLLDIGLPDMDGYEVCRRLAALPGMDKAILVAQTGWAQAADKRRAQEAGFHHHLAKPVKLERIREILSIRSG